jgi:alcohol dehydrogenase YqhD (iron-dependent ADH family)
MHSFSFHLPTHLLFGSGHLSTFAKEVAGLGKHAFLVTGGGSVHRLGYLDTVTAGLRKAGLQVTVFSGIEPNPESATVDRAVEAGRAAGVDVVVALGGGSAMDAAKGIAALLATPGAKSIWPYVAGEPLAGQLKAALPIAAIPTTAATASEVTPYSVLSNRATKGKSVLAHEFLKPRIAWLNPAFTTALPANVTQDGAADILSHVFENYLAGDGSSPIADRHCEAIILTVVETLPALLKEPANEELRGRLLWASTLALCGLQSAGRRESGFPMHAIEHALSGLRPELAHGRGLATIFPAYFRWMHASGRSTARLAQLGRRIFGVGGDEPAAAAGFIAHFEAWLVSNGLRQSLASLGFSSKDYPIVAAYAVRVYGNGEATDAGGPLKASDIVDILEAS